ncbi:hypothetical protein AXK11_07250 [Cephaloticoccus primus]|uniref:Uncharacterized protein n=1 Tax=Cephaloticoccus primus TaxID=1548207 RepID=A0A139SKQ1_9BACT|nr:type ISP restriction/modification enzyme [Cephaloticoccus primus]KXU35141.1 hypothetical protein AXK11_07250 [Cephaloticoccus primus]
MSTSQPAAAPQPTATALQKLLESIRQTARHESEKGRLFERLVTDYLSHEPGFRALYAQVQPYAAWAKEQSQWELNPNDTGIDLVATTHAGEHHAVQCKCYAADRVISKPDIDSFMSASGHRAFSARLLIDTTCKPLGSNAEQMLQQQQIPATRINLEALETSAIDWARYALPQAPATPAAVFLKPKNQSRPHQQAAIADVLHGLRQHPRGKLIMACGSGKTFTALRIAEATASPEGHILFLVPSLALLSQTLTEWTQQSTLPITAFAVCSDTEVGSGTKPAHTSDTEQGDHFRLSLHELAYPATTRASALAMQHAARRRPASMTVIFSTYHSLGVIERAQKEHGLPPFDLVICDEAHRTTGQTWEGDEESHFVRIHDNTAIRATKRLYMTATPRIYDAESQQQTQKAKDLTLYSMDDEAIYGPTFHALTFSAAVEQKLLVPYKVIVLTIEEKEINERVQKLLTDENNSLRMDDAAKIIGCFKALAKEGLADLSDDPAPMRRAVAFCQIIDRERGANTGKGGGRSNKTAARQIAQMFGAVVEEYQNTASPEEKATQRSMRLRCEADYVHGGMGAAEKTQKINWLKDDSADDTCRILTNVRCLSEGVDVPALDAVLFLTPRNSQVEVVQSVGRVMRKAPDKKRGYIILPVVIPSGIEPHRALNDNKTYKVVWQVLQALRSHDDEFDRFINRIELLGSDPQRIEIVAVTGLAARKPRQSGGDKPIIDTRTDTGIGTAPPQPPPDEQTQIRFPTGELERAILAKVVQKVGNRDHWEQWAQDIGRIAQLQIAQIKTIISDPRRVEAIAAFEQFKAQLHKHINTSIGQDEIVEMLAQHLITKPVFDALFGGDHFSRNNPISLALQTVTDILLADSSLDRERQALDSFYEDVRKRSSGIDDPTARQTLIITLYDQFFAKAFPKVVSKHGIVYTPIEVVDFILHSVTHLLHTHFGKTLESEDVQLLDPFTGTGTFMARLLASGLIAPEHLPRVYQQQLHATEILLLPYYIAAVNIESTFAQHCPGAPYTPFPGILLADTFNIPTEKTETLLENKNDALAANNARRKRQMESKITVIIGNPPYSVGQKSENDQNKNVAYPELDNRIKQTYSARGTATSKKSLVDSYIRAIRWASDRIDPQTGGIIGFVTNAGWLDSAATDGMRKCLTEEFSSLYIFHLRGDIRSEIRGNVKDKKEGGNVFGQGSTTGVVISLLVKTPQHQTGQAGKIHYCDIGDYLSREQKLEKIAELKSIAGIAEQDLWQAITPDEKNDWLNQRSGEFADLLPMGDAKNKNKPANTGIFENFSNGVKTNRDAWCNNPSRAALLENVQRMVSFYEEQRSAFNRQYAQTPTKERKEALAGFIDTDPTKISWTRELLADFAQNKQLTFHPQAAMPTLYRPFSKGWLYYNRMLNNCVYQMPQIFPLPVSGPATEEASGQDGLFAAPEKPTLAQANVENRLICVTGIGARNFSVLMSGCMVDIQLILNGQCFPEYLYNSQGQPKHAITDAALAAFQVHYGKDGTTITKTQIFEYIYAILHSPQYRETFANNLTKELPRIPFAASFEDFCAFAEAGQQLANLHIGYEHAPLDTSVHIDIHKKNCTTLDELQPEDFYVEKMKYGKTEKTQANKTGKDFSVIHYNRHITVRNIPLDAYHYIVNGRPAIDWIIDRQRIRTDKASGIVSDANRYATETLNNPRYPLELLLRLITVSLETRKIVRTLPTFSA